MTEVKQTVTATEAVEKVADQTGQGEQSPGTIWFHSGEMHKWDRIISHRTADTIENGESVVAEDDS